MKPKFKVGDIICGNNLKFYTVYEVLDIINYDRYVLKLVDYYNKKFKIGNVYEYFIQNIDNNCHVKLNYNEILKALL